MQINEAGLTIIKAAECGAGINAKHTKDKDPRKGLYRYRTCYRDGGGVPTIGYGNTKSVGKADVDKKTITEAEADALLLSDLKDAHTDLDRLMATSRVALNANQYSALISWVFNLGITKLKGSTAWKLISAGDYAKGAEALMWWNKDGTGPGGALEVQPGLVIRRRQERDLFLKPVAN